PGGDRVASTPGGRRPPKLVHRRYQDLRAQGSRRPDQPGLVPPEAVTIERTTSPKPYAGAPAQVLENALPWFGAPVPWSGRPRSGAGAAFDRASRPDRGRRMDAENGHRSACRVRVALPRPTK